MNTSQTRLRLIVRKLDQLSATNVHSRLILPVKTRSQYTQTCLESIRHARIRCHNKEQYCEYAVMHIDRHTLSKLQYVNCARDFCLFLRGVAAAGSCRTPGGADYCTIANRTVVCPERCDKKSCLFLYSCCGLHDRSAASCSRAKVLSDSDVVALTR